MTPLDRADSIYASYSSFVGSMCIKSLNKIGYTSKAFKTRLVKIGRDRFFP